MHIRANLSKYMVLDKIKVIYLQVTYNLIQICAETDST